MPGKKICAWELRGKRAFDPLERSDVARGWQETFDEEAGLVQTCGGYSCAMRLHAGFLQIH